MTDITNRNIVEYTYTGDTIQDLLEEVLDMIRQGKFLREDKLIHSYIIWDEEYGWVMKAMVSTYEHKK